MGLCGNDPPDPADAYVGGIEADLETLPIRRQIEVAAQLGIPVTIDIPGKGPTKFDFSGLGQGDYQAKFADDMAAQLLKLQQDMGPDYVQQRLHELQRADPEGYAARRQLYDSILKDVQESQTADRPAAEQLQSLILGELQKGGQLPESIRRRVEQGVRGQQVARGNYLGNAAATAEASAVVNATEQERAARQEQALQFLTTGVSPEDVAYRRGQQSLQNLGAFLSGETPVAQFGQLSGAQNQIVPFTGTNQPLPGTDPNAGQRGIDFSQGIYSASLGQGTNPWLMGLTGGVQGLNIWSSLGGSFKSPATKAQAAPTTQSNPWAQYE